MNLSKKNAKIVGTITLGWILVLIGVGAIFLPGPGLLALFAGFALLATRYSWAERRLEPIKVAALKTAKESVSNIYRFTLSITAALAIIGVGIIWGFSPPAPAWWPLPEKFWLIGGWGTGGTMIASGVIAIAMLVFSHFYFKQKSH